MSVSHKPHAVVQHEQWVNARKELVAKEKEFTRLKDQISQLRRDLPWECVTGDYVFEGPRGKETLAQLFDGRLQLIVYHFMYAPEWTEGCPSCSFWADNFNGLIVHLNHRDISMVAISRAPYEQLAAYQKRMGWTFKWLSSGGNRFNYDYGVSFPDGARSVTYNFMQIDPEGETDLPGISVFYKNDAGEIFRTYSCYSRGIDLMNTAYNYMDLTPIGRNEGDGNMRWLRRHDQYDT